MLLFMFITLYKMVLTFESVDEILKCDNIQMKAVVLFITPYKMDQNFQSADEILQCDHSNANFQ